MKNLTVSVPDDLHEKMQGISWVNWSAVAREAFYKKIKEIMQMKKEVTKVQEES